MTQVQNLTITSTNNTLSISASFVRLLLQTSQEHLTPRFYSKFLREAGLERFANELPSPEVVPVASFNEIAAFMALIYGVTRDGVYPLFCQNLGNGISKQFISQPHWLAMKEKAVEMFANNKLLPEEKLAQLAALKNTLPRNGVKWEARGLEMIASTSRCFYCHNLKTDKPICYARVAYLGTALQWLTGWSFYGEQYQALSCGDAACAYRFKPVDVRQLT